MTPVRLSHPVVAKLMRYAGVSAIVVVITQGLLFALNSGAGLSGTLSNGIAVTVAAVPAYFLNRAWVWAISGPHHLWREVLPFWMYALLGLVVSTVVVAVVTDAWGAGVAANVANLGAYLVLWVAKFVFLDRLIFSAAVHAEELAAS